MNWIPGSNEPELALLGPKIGRWVDSLKFKISPESIRKTVERLPAPRNRLHAPGAMQVADQMIWQGFRDCKWEAQIRPFTFKDATGFLDYGEASNFTSQMTYEHLEGVNVVAIKPGEESSGAFVVFGHHDTIRDSPGANDNTASVAVILELAQALTSSRFRRTIILAATDMEEIGFFGGRALVTELVRERTILGAVNYETMAYTSSDPGSQTLPAGIELIYSDQVRRIRSNRFKGEFTTFIYNSPATRLAAAIASGLIHLEGEQAALMLRDPNDLPFIGGLLRRAVPAVRNFARSDHVPFWKAGVPAIMVTDTANFRYCHYHTPGDTPEKLDYQRLAMIGCATAAGLAQLAGLVQ
jgi:hypothetical protein